MGINTENNNVTFSWPKDYPAPVTVCNTQGVIIAMNNRAIQQFKKRGGAQLIGTSLFDCHPKLANTIIRKQLKTQKENIYITEGKSGQKLVQQVPWYQDGVFAGLVETVTPIPDDLPIKQRD